ncbi:hypothetical protein [Mycoplasma leonicaptivi]|uniref:hypothetical protein n=1 Tax=Mycoplasma leonicaptivi TaxID=36742 RepID=UPI000AD882B1|nr:hypothetical protein [Mycoplasma leonicaptivi]
MKNKKIKRNWIYVLLVALSFTVGAGIVTGVFFGITKKYWDSSQTNNKIENK